MLNPTFSRKAQHWVLRPYVLDNDSAQSTVFGNSSFSTSPERRLQRIYGDEIWSKIKAAELTIEKLAAGDVLEMCGGTGFLSYHLLKRCKPGSYTINDISLHEMELAKSLLSQSRLDDEVNWVLGDMHYVDFKRRFDVIIGNSFLHHFHNVPQVLARCASLLNRNGMFISLHEPTPMSTVVEGGKILAYPFAVAFPQLINEIARLRYKGLPSNTDIWMFEVRQLREVALQAGFARVKFIPWGLMRPTVVQRGGLHLGECKPSLSFSEVSMLSRAIRLDSMLNRLLPSRFFGSICLVCYK